jgi:hypothetical protein
MYHQRQMELNGPLHLLLKRQQLLLLKLAAPIKVKTDLADSDKRALPDSLMRGREVGS